VIVVPLARRRADAPRRSAADADGAAITPSPRPKNKQKHTDKILSKFGEGTFGRVLECWDRLERDYVAVKVRRRGSGG
jgi:hypothetical protein